MGKKITVQKEKFMELVTKEHYKKASIVMIEHALKNVDSCDPIKYDFKYSDVLKFYLGTVVGEYN